MSVRFSVALTSFAAAAAYASAALLPETAVALRLPEAASEVDASEEGGLSSPGAKQPAVEGSPVVIAQGEKTPNVDAEEPMDVSSGSRSPLRKLQSSGDLLWKFEDESDRDQRNVAELSELTNADGWDLTDGYSRGNGEKGRDNKLFFHFLHGLNASYPQSYPFLSEDSRELDRPQLSEQLSDSANGQPADENSSIDIAHVVKERPTPDAGASSGPNDTRQTHQSAKSSKLSTSGSWRQNMTFASAAEMKVAPETASAAAASVSKAPEGAPRTSSTALQHEQHQSVPLAAAAYDAEPTESLLLRGEEQGLASEELPSHESAEVSMDKPLSVGGDFLNSMLKGLNLAKALLGRWSPTMTRGGKLWSDEDRYVSSLEEHPCLHGNDINKAMLVQQAERGESGREKWMLLEPHALNYATPDQSDDDEPGQVMADWSQPIYV